jgi:hypothetical protein
MDWRLKLFLFAAGGFVLALLPPAAWLAIAAFIAAGVFAGVLAFSFWALGMIGRGFLRALRTHIDTK